MLWGKPKKLKPFKQEYAKAVDSAIPFGGKKWKFFGYSEGCMPLLTAQTVSLDGVKWGEVQPQKAPPPPAVDSTKIPSAEMTFAQLWQLSEKLAENQRAEQAAEAKAKKEAEDIKNGVRPEGVEVDEGELETFDLQDIKLGMRAMGWDVAARMIARWFDNPAYTFKEKNKEVRKAHPQDSTSISLKWARKFGDVSKKYNELIDSLVYSPNALLKEIKPSCEAQIMQDFRRSIEKIPEPQGFATDASLGNLQEFHKQWHFTHNSISFFEAAGSYTKLNELVAILGGFALYAAIGKVFLSCSKRLEYDNKKGLKRWVFDPLVSLTHIYVYLMDKFEFTDTVEDKKSQYLGHWNKHGVIVTYKGGASEIDRKFLHFFRSHFDEKPITETVRNQILPVSINGEMKVYTSEAVYWPVFNSTFNQWRNKHGRGQDCMVFSMPELIKLKKPIEWKMDMVYGEWEGVNENNL